MNSEAGGDSGNGTCIIVGPNAKENLIKRGEYVRLSVLIDLLRRTGTPESALQALAVVLWADNTQLSERGGMFLPGSRTFYRASKDVPERVFTPVIHIDLRAQFSLRFTILHEAGHVRAYARGNIGTVLYDRGFERWVKIFCGLLTIVVYVFAFRANNYFLFFFAMASHAAALFPMRALWFVSTGEWKANWFAWRHRHVDVVGDEPDGTEMVYSPGGCINGEQVVG